jgi:hypothetical protein
MCEHVLTDTIHTGQLVQIWCYDCDSVIDIIDLGEIPGTPWPPVNEAAFADAMQGVPQSE